MVCLVGGYRDALRFKAVSVYILPVSHGVSCGRIPGCSQVQGCKCISFLSAIVCLVGGHIPGFSRDVYCRFVQH